MTTSILSRSSVAQINSTSTSILNTLTTYNFTEDTYLSEQINRLLQSNNQMTEALNENTPNNFLAAKDKKRDNAVRVIFYEVKSKALWPDPTISEAANKILNILDNYGLELINFGYATESAHINAMLQDLKNRDLASTIDTLPGLQILVDQLEIAQDEFETSYQEYISQEVERKDLLSAGKIGDIIIHQINKELLVYLTAMSRVKPEMYGECTQKIETIIKENNDKVRAKTKFLNKEMDMGSN
ncbi:hypothetical protein E9993_09830 [Labilibacter sediminis]|nr:hypothetical protein E9993_09830 [Labilibacter sediminis]